MDLIFIVGIILIFVLIFIFMLPAFVNLEGFVPINNAYRNDVYLNPPPADISYNYNPQKMQPIHIYKKSFMEYPIEGFRHNI